MKINAKIKELLGSIREFFSGRKFDKEGLKAVVTIFGGVFGAFGGMFAFVAFLHYAASNHPEILVAAFLSGLVLLLLFTAFCAIFPKEEVRTANEKEGIKDA